MTLHVRELTPRGHGAVSVIRVGGDAAFDRVRTLAPRMRRDVREPQVVRLRVLDEDVDEAIVCVLSPSEVELHVHGSPPLVRRILARIVGDGAPNHDLQAELDERCPTARTIEERARERLVHAAADSGARVLLDQAEGALRRALYELGRANARERGAAVGEMLERGRIARFALEPVEVALAGAVNAGKSTLFNALLGEERTIVSAEAGTTRDAVRERGVIGAYPVVLIDTPGERSPPAATDALERASQRESLRARRDAELILWLERADGHDRGTHVALQVDGARRRVVHTQLDRLPHAESDRFPQGISALHQPESARARIQAMFLAAFELPAEPWCAGRAVPFDADSVAGLRSLPLDAPTDVWRRSVDALLGAP